jgi:hypothetical protein
MLRLVPSKFSASFVRRITFWGDFGGDAVLIPENSNKLLMSVGVLELSSRFFFNCVTEWSGPAV